MSAISLFCRRWSNLSKEFKKLVKKGLEDIKLDRIKPWKEVWDEL
jgi:hypothetical protein